MSNNKDALSGKKDSTNAQRPIPKQLEWCVRTRLKAIMKNPTLPWDETCGCSDCNDRRAMDAGVPLEAVLSFRLSQIVRPNELAYRGDTPDRPAEAIVSVQRSTEPSP
jgi:hypothetical protein